MFQVTVDNSVVMDFLEALSDLRNNKAGVILWQSIDAKGAQIAKKVTAASEQTADDDDAAADKTR